MPEGSILDLMGKVKRSKVETVLPCLNFLLLLDLSPTLPEVRSEGEAAHGESEECEC